MCDSRDAIILSITDTFTAFLAGFVIFATLGFMAHQTQSEISSVVTDGKIVLFSYDPSFVRWKVIKAAAYLLLVFS